MTVNPAGGEHDEDREAGNRYRDAQAERMIAAWRDYCAAEGRSEEIDLADKAQAAEFLRVWLARLALDGIDADQP